MRNHIRAGEKPSTGWKETAYRLVRNYIEAVDTIYRLVRHYIQAGEKLYSSWEENHVEVIQAVRNYIMAGEKL